MAIYTRWGAEVQVMGSPGDGLVTIRRSNNRTSVVLRSELTADRGEREIDRALLQAQANNKEAQHGKE